MSANPTPEGLVEVKGIDFGGLARQAIAVEIAKALQTSDETVKRLIVESIRRRVAGDGKPSSYGEHYNTMTWIEYVLAEAIRAEVTAAIKTHVEEMRPALQKQIVATLTSQKAAIAGQLAETLISNAKCGYGLEISVAVKPRER